MGVADLIVLITFFAVLLPLGRALVRRMDRDDRRVEANDRRGHVEGSATSEEIAALRRQVAELSQRVDSIGEEQDFLVRLLEERPALRAPEPEGRRSSGT